MSQYKRKPKAEKAACARCERCTCSGRAPRGQEGRGVECGESCSRNVECYNCKRRGHYAKECWFKQKEGNLMVAGVEKTPKKVSSEEEWNALATIAIVNMVEVKEAVESKEEEIDFEP